MEASPTNHFQHLDKIPVQQGENIPPLKIHEIKILFIFQVMQRTDYKIKIVIRQKLFGIGIAICPFS